MGRKNKLGLEGKKDGALRERSPVVVVVAEHLLACEPRFKASCRLFQVLCFPEKSTHFHEWCYEFRERMENIAEHMRLKIFW